MIQRVPMLHQQDIQSCQLLDWLLTMKAQSTGSTSGTNLVSRKASIVIPEGIFHSSKPAYAIRFLRLTLVWVGTIAIMTLFNLHSWNELLVNFMSFHSKNLPGPWLPSDAFVLIGDIFPVSPRVFPTNLFFGKSDTPKTPWLSYKTYAKSGLWVR